MLEMRISGKVFESLLTTYPNLILDHPAIFTDVGDCILITNHKFSWVKSCQSLFASANSYPK